MKKQVLYYDQNKIARLDNNLNEFIQPCTPATSSWLDSFSLFHSGIKSLKDWWASDLPLQTETIPYTVKACPGISDLFSSSILVKFPSDFLLHIDVDEQNNNYHVRFNSSDGMIKVESHPRSQYTNEKSNHFHDQINIKFIFDFEVMPDFDHKIIYLPPVYHTKNVPYSILPGIINHYKNIKVRLIVNTMFPYKNQTHHFKAGTPFGYMTFLNGKIPELKPKNLEDVLDFGDKRRTFFRYYRSIKVD